MKILCSLKRGIGIVLISALLSGLVPQSMVLKEVLPNTVMTAEAAKPAVQAKAYVVMDANSGDIIYKKSMNKKIYPASTVKLMTAIVVLEHAKPDKRIKFTKKMKNLLPSDAANLGLKTGTSYSVKQYLNLLLIASDADSAMALAVGVAGSHNKFIKWMNNKAKSFGMQNTSFDNPIGLDIGNSYKKTYTTAYDFTILARHAMSNQTIRNIVSKSSYKVPARKKKPSFIIKNTNAFYSQYKLNGKGYEIIGSKTGTTGAAGRCLIATARDDEGHELICSYFGGNSSYALYNGIEKLFDYAYKQYKNGKIAFSIGFWDTRYRYSEGTICKYATTGIIPMNDNGKFNPENVREVSYTVKLINSISGLNMAAEEADGLTVTELARAYYDAKNIDIENGEEAAPANENVINELSDEELDIIVLIDNTDNIDIETQKKVAYLYLSGIMNSVNINDANHMITKEEAVMIADAILQNFE